MVSSLINSYSTVVVHVVKHKQFGKDHQLNKST